MGPHLPLNAVTSVQRFDGRDLGRAPHIAVLGSCKLGNFVASLPLLRLLRRRYPEAQIDFWGSEATADFERALCGEGQPLDWRISWDQPHAEGDQTQADWRRSPTPLAKGKRKLAHSTWRSTATVSTRSPRP